MDKKEKVPFSKKFALMNPGKKGFVILSLVYGIVFILLTPLFFLRHSDWPWGWLLGSAVSLFAYWSIGKIPDLLFGKGKGGMTILSMVLMFSRILLYGASLFISAICTFKPEWFGGWNLLSFWGVMLAIIPMPLVLILTNILDVGKPPKINTLSPATDEKDEETEAKK